MNASFAIRNHREVISQKPSFLTLLLFYDNHLVASVAATQSLCQDREERERERERERARGRDRGETFAKAECLLPDQPWEDRLCYITSRQWAAHVLGTPISGHRLAHSRGLPRAIGSLRENTSQWPRSTTNKEDRKAHFSGQFFCWHHTSEDRTDY